MNKEIIKKIKSLPRYTFLTDEREFTTADVISREKVIELIKKEETIIYQAKNWQEEFDKEFVDRISGDMWQTTSREKIKQFISTLLEEQMKEERNRIYDYIEEKLLGEDDELLKDLANIIFDKSLINK